MNSQPIRITKTNYRNKKRFWVLKRDKEKGWNTEYLLNHRWMMGAGPNYMPLPKKGNKTPECIFTPII